MSARITTFSDLEVLNGVYVRLPTIESRRHPRKMELIESYVQAKARPRDLYEELLQATDSGSLLFNNESGPKIEIAIENSDAINIGNQTVAPSEETEFVDVNPSQHCGACERKVSAWNLVLRKTTSLPVVVLNLF